jgi:sigma-E factor negative regulatory protein RseA
MKEQFDEQISAFMDGELAEQEHTHIISQLCKNETLKDRWQRYHLVSDAMKNNLPPAIGAQFAQSVMKALENEPTILAPETFKERSIHVKRKIASIAVAASVAAVAVIGVQTMNQSNDAAPSLAEMPSSDQYVRLAQPNPNIANANVSNANVTNASIGTTIPALKASARQENSQEAQLVPIIQYHPQLNKYLVDHNQYISGSQVQGIMPYARIVVSPLQSSLPLSESIVQGQQ